MLYMFAEAQAVGLLLLLSWASYQGAVSKVEQLEIKQVFVRDAGATDSGFMCCAVVLPWCQPLLHSLFTVCKKSLNGTFDRVNFRLYKLHVSLKSIF